LVDYPGHGGPGPEALAGQLAIGAACLWESHARDTGGAPVGSHTYASDKTKTSFGSSSLGTEAFPEITLESELD